MHDSPSQETKRPSESSLAPHLTYIAVILGLVAALVGTGHLIAWLGGHLSQRGFSTITMKTNAALCLTLVGVALMLLAPAELHETRRWIARVFAGLALLTALPTFVENLSGWDFGIDQLLATEAPGALAVTSPNRMGLTASLGFTLIGAALLRLSRADRRRVSVVQILAVVICLIGLLPTIGFLYGAHELYGIARYTGIAWPTAVSLLLVGVGLLCARPTDGLMEQITGNDPGGVSLRRLLPGLVILPLLLGWLRLAGERAGVFDAATGTGMMMATFIILFSSLAFYAARRARRWAEALGESEERFRVAQELSPDGFTIFHPVRDVSGTIVDFTWVYENAAIARLNGTNPKQVVGRRLLDLFPGHRGSPFFEVYRQVAESGEPRVLEAPYEGDSIPIQTWFRVAVVSMGEDIAVLAQDITSHKRAEEALRESHARLKKVLEVETVGVMLWDLTTGCMTDANETFLRTMGYSRGEVEARELTWQKLTPPEYMEVSRAEIRKFQATGRVGPYEKEYFRKDGTRQWLLFAGSSLGGNVCVEFCVDIADRKRAEEALRRSEERLRQRVEEVETLMKVAPVAIWVAHDPGCNHIIGNWMADSFYEAYEQENVSANVSPARRFFTDGRELPAEQLPMQEAAAKNVNIRNREVDVLLPSGKWLNMLGSASPLRDAKGQVRGCIGAFVDITERKRAEEVVKWSARRDELLSQAAARLLESTDPQGLVEDVCRQVMDFLDCHAFFNFLVDERSGRLHLNACAGIPAEEARRIEWLDYGVAVCGCVARDQVRIIAEDICHTPDSRTELVNSYGIQAYCCHPLKIQDRLIGTLSFGTRSRPRFSAAEIEVMKTVTDLVAMAMHRIEIERTLRDLNETLESKVAARTTELRHRAQQLQKLTLELTQAEERERRRIAVILHEDLQQQIAGAKFQLDVVRSQALDNRQRTDVDKVDTILTEAIEKSRDLSRDLSPPVVHMNDLAEVLAGLVDRVREQQGLEVRVTLQGSMTLHSEALAMFLFRAAQEMLFNVVKHARVREAEIRARRIGRRYVCLSVCDQGRGFDPHELDRTSGVGLLSIRERTESLGGRMAVKSAQGQGSRVRIIVPDGPGGNGQPDASEEVADRRSVPSLVPPIPADRAVRVLLVDDHEIVREGLAALLQEAPDIKVVGEAPDGREAINLALALRPDVVIMDVYLPLVSGDQATRHIKARLPATRVIALSMFDEADKKETMCQAGASAYVLKTASSEELLAAIRGQKSNS